MTTNTQVRPFIIVALFVIASFTVASVALMWTSGTVTFAQAQECIQYDWQGGCVEYAADADPGSADWPWKRGGGTASDVTLSGQGGYSGTVHFADGDVTFANDNGTWINDALGYSSAQSLLQAIVVAGSSHGGSVTTTVNSAGVLTSVACNNGVTASIASEEDSCVSNQGTSCTSAPNSCGMVNGGGTIQCNGSCSASVPSDSLCTVTTVTPPTTTDTNTCVSNAGQACTSAANSCGMTGSGGTVQCNGSCSSAVPSDTLCEQPVVEDVCVPAYICTGSAIVNTCTNAVVQQCSYGCSGGSSGCAAAPSLTVEDELHAQPSLVQQGGTTRLFWRVLNASSCTVTENNPTISDSWTDSDSGTAGKLSSAIGSQTIYTLLCMGLPEATPASISQTATVNIAPIFQEQ